MIDRNLMRNAIRIVCGADPLERSNARHIVHARCVMIWLLKDQRWAIARIASFVKQQRATVAHALNKPRPADCDAVIAAMASGPQAPVSSEAESLASSARRLVTAMNAASRAFGAFLEALPADQRDRL